MSSMVIVAIPDEFDPVWKTSSEKIPHLTMLFLGDTANISAEDTAEIVQFVEHLSKDTAHRFGLQVDRRGTLGDDNADVLFFDKEWTKPVEEIRNFMLSNDAINQAYSSVEQYPQWTPHLTLGYPATPAKPLDREFGISYVHFDRLAVWTGDFEGPTFELNDNDRALAMSGTNSFIEGFLNHARKPFEESSVKRDGGGQFARKSGLPGLDDLKKDAKWMSNLLDLEADIMSDSLSRLEPVYKIVLKKYGLKTVSDIDSNPDAAKETASAHARILNSIAIKKGTSPSGKYRLKYSSSYVSADTTVSKRPDLIEVATGKAVKPPKSVTHEDVSEFIEHFGTKGMRWGVLNNKPTGLVTKKREINVIRDVKVRGRGDRTLDENKKVNIALSAQKSARAGLKNFNKNYLKDNPPKDSTQFSKAEKKSYDKALSNYVARHVVDKTENPPKVGPIDYFASPFPETKGQARFQLAFEVTYFAGFLKGHILEHDDSDKIVFDVDIVLDDQGVVSDISITPASTSVTHSNVDSVLAHFGIKGMKWGIRRERDSSSGRVGGSSEDAAIANVYRQRAVKSGVSSLSNAELKVLNDRISLENNFNKWREKNPTKLEKAKKWISDFVRSQADSLIKDLIADNEVISQINQAMGGSSKKKNSNSNADQRQKEQNARDKVRQQRAADRRATSDNRRRNAQTLRDLIDRGSTRPTRRGKPTPPNGPSASPVRFGTPSTPSGPNRNGVYNISSI